jgi:hypothetical protein
MNKIIEKILIVLAIIFFVILNTRYYWEGGLGFGFLIVVLVLYLFFAMLVIAFIYYITISILSRSFSKKRILLFVVLFLVIGFTIYKPFGLVNFDKLEGENIFIAHREGAANCMITLKLKESGYFTQRTVCFGVDKISGKFTLKNDTLWFSEVSKEKDFYKFGTFNEKIKNTIFLHNSKTDSLPLNMFVEINLLIDSK